MSIRTVERKGYLKKLESFRDNTQFVKVIMGVRRCGKSTLLDQYIERLRSSGVEDREILHMNLESSDYDSMKDYRDLNAYLGERVPKKGRFYVFIDEVQRIEGWERSVNALMVDSEADIYITGSNAHILSTDLSTFLTGRYVSIDMLPLSFAEYLELRGDNKRERAVFSDFLRYGGFPAVDPSAGPIALTSTLRDLHNSIMYEDIVSRGNIRNTEDLERIVQYLMFNIGNIISAKKISEELGGISRETVDRYIGLLREACLIYRSDRFDLRSAALRPTPKYYSVDQGLRNMSVGFRDQDLGRVLENVVYLELVRRGYNVQVGTWGSKEVDFVADLPMRGKEYFQVCLGYSDEETRKRELAPLRAIKDNFPKTLILLNGWTDSATEDGIMVKDAVDWLLGRDGTS
jgi:predicted AAA+ superfamily ATPase